MSDTTRNIPAKVSAGAGAILKGGTLNKEDAQNSIRRAAMAYQRATVLIEGSPDSQIKGAMHELHNAVAALIAAVEFVVEG